MPGPIVNGGWHVGLIKARIGDDSLVFGSGERVVRMEDLDRLTPKGKK